MTAPVLELRGIRKRFGSVQALRGADFVLASGEIHALLGENGAGKSTLMHVAYGIVHADAGEIHCDGVPAAIRSPRDARARGIGMVHQHFTSVPALTAEENVRLALGPAGWGRRLDWGRSAVLERLWAGLVPSARVAELSVGLRQRLEIVKALAADARILLLDEPTAVLAPREVEELLSAIRAFAQEGGAVVLITHKLAEVLAAAHQVTVLRHGRVTFSGATAGQSEESLARAMIGTTVEEGQEARGVHARQGVREVAVRAEQLVVPPLEGRGPGLQDASFEIRAGEIVGVAAIEGNGQRELLLAVAGLLSLSAGRLEVASPTVLVPEDRTTEGLIPALSVVENTVLGWPGRAPWRRGPWLDWARARAHTAALLERHAVRAPSLDVPAATLSGGNQQKLVLARALEQRPRVLVAENPTRGLDIQATVTIQGRLRQAAEEGAAVLLYSTDLDEVRSLAERILVVAGGRVRWFEAGATRDALGSAMLGLSPQAAA
jgi:simple sugar transport system ATP-binding protein